MTRDSRYDVLFEPLQIGPVRTKNRFYQVPHCTGMGYQRPNTLHHMRETTAEGGWGVVCTEYCSIHPSANEDPHPQCTLWDEGDVRTLADMVERVHRHDALAGVELWYGGYSTINPLTRERSLAPSSMPAWHGAAQTQAMRKSDIARLRGWHRDAALRAKRAGFDIIYVYAAHGYLPAQFLSPVHNRRSDEYGGCFENRARLIKELLEETKEAVGDTCAVAFRFAVDDLDSDSGITRDGDGRALVEYVAELPDLWDVNIANFEADARTSRFAPEAAQEAYVDFVKQVTTKPVVGVGRFTSPDTMVGQINRGILDLIGAARPSIADPFLPRKIEEGRPEDIRECIGCNICIKANSDAVPLRCTQNPTRGEEWRRGWHPESIEGRHADESVLVVGAGPAGLEAARALGRRGYRVVLAEATETLGGRVTREATLPGLAEWSRVREYRLGQLNQLDNVEIYRDSRLDADQVLEYAFTHVCIATGSRWRTDGAGRSSYHPIEGHEHPGVRSVDEVLDGGPGPIGGPVPIGSPPIGSPPIGSPVVVYDDDHFYMGGAIAQRLREAGGAVTIVSTAGEVSPLAHGTLDQGRIQAQLIEAGVDIVVSHRVTGFDGERAVIACIYTGRTRTIPCVSVVPVTAREPSDQLYLELVADEERLRNAGIRTLERIGDCAAPRLIADAVFEGHRYARELGANFADAARDRVVLS